MSEHSTNAAQADLRAHPLGSIMARIFAGFFLVLLLLAVMAATVWRAGQEVGQALRADELSQAADGRIDEVQDALTESRLRMAAYLRTEGAPERGALAVAMDRLQTAADVHHAPPQGLDLSDITATIQPVRAALSNVADAIESRRSAVAALAAASAALSNSSTALAENVARLGDNALAAAGTALLADVGRAIMTDGRGAAAEDAPQFVTAIAVIDHGRQVLAAIADAGADSVRIQRLAAVVGPDLDAMRTAVIKVQATIARRSALLSMLTKTASQAAASAGEQARAITAERTLRRERSMAAQKSLQATILETAVVACILGLTIALSLGLSITRPLRRLALAMRGLADGALDTVVPGITKHDEVGAMADALVALKDRSAHLTTHDSLTGLPNRVLFQNCLDHSLAWSRRHGGTLAVIFLDLDHFKDVNDTLGHSAGDQLLVQVASKLGACLRETDVLARLGGDEFAILQVNARHLADVETLARRVVDELSKAFDVNGQTMTLGTSAGISVRGETELRLSPCDPGLLLQEADVALYRAKEEGRGTYRFFEAAMNAKLQERRALESDLREALASHQFRLHYQPQFDLAERRIIGAEALIRWSHPRRGEVSPGEFIPLAEQTGLIIQIGEWVLMEACRQAAAWPELGCMAVNVSPVQFRRPGFVELVQHALQQAGLVPQRLEVEITEGVLLTETPETLSILHRLRRLGVTIAMDDFGTGYSSLGYLQKFRFDKIKIDRSFVSNIGKDPQASEIVRAVLRMSHAMGIRVNAEGIELQQQIPTLQEEGCEEVQGFLFGRPLPADEFAERLACPAMTISY